MSKFLTTDRKRTLLSMVLGVGLIALSVFLIFPDPFALPFLVLIIPIAVFLIHIVPPKICCSGRNITFKKGKFRNADKQDITTELPRTLIPQFLAWILISFILINRLNLLTKYLISLFDGGSTWISIVEYLGIVMIFSTPYLVIHLYFFIKNLPVSTFFLYFQNSNGSNNRSSYYSNNHGVNFPEPSRSDYYNSASYSTIPGNIYNHRN